MTSTRTEQRSTKPNKSELRALYKQQLSAYEASLHALQKELRKLLEQHGYSPAIKDRVKRFEAYYDKYCRMVTKGGGQVGALSDLLGIRIVCPFLSDVEQVERLIRERFEVIEVERKARQHSFREFGYDSVHLLIAHESEGVASPLPGSLPVCEVQLRTILQDAWAEVEHELVYKSDIDLPNESIRRKLASLNATLTLSDLIFQEIRDFQEEVRQRGRKRRESVNRGRREWAGQAPDAESTPATALRLGPVPTTLTSDLEKLMLLALEAHSNQDFTTAIDLYGRLLGMKLTQRVRALVYNHRGMALFATGETRLAIRDFSKALEFDPGNIRGLLNRGLCHRVLKQFDQALADYDRALLLDSDHDEGYFDRAQCYFEMGLYDQALTDSNEMLRRNPEHQSARNLRQLIHRAML